jgi:phosphoglycerate kinase
MRTIQSLGSLAGKTVIVRCDLNVPLEDRVITDDGRIRASLETLQALLSSGASLVVMSHLGRPAGKVEADLSLSPVATRLSELLDTPVLFISDCIGESATETIEKLRNGDARIAVLENLRFEPAETSKNPDERLAFAQRLSQYGSAYVLDGFGVVHREQASVTELASLLPSAGGILIERELNVLNSLTEQVKRPYCVVLGGSKVSDKLGVIEHLLSRVDTLLIGGGMVFTFLAALGHKIGESLVEPLEFETVLGYLEKASQLGVRIVLPQDIVVADSFSADARTEIVSADDIEGSSFGSSALGLDIGPKTSEEFASIISRAETVFWNGPMGVFEFEAFSHGTRAIAQALTEVQGLAVVGGGDSAAAIRLLGFEDAEFGHISTGGGASLEFLEGKSLPGLEAIGWS